MIVKGLLLAAVATTAPVAVYTTIQDPGSDAVPTTDAVEGSEDAARTAAASEIEVLRAEVASLRGQLADCEGERAVMADIETRLQEALATVERAHDTLRQRDAELEEVWELAASGRHRDNCTPSRALLTRWKWSTRRGNTEEADKTLAAIVERHGRSGDHLNRLAWNLMTEDGVRGDHDALALVLSERMLEVDRRPNHAHLDTAALAFFLNGKVERAIELQQQAVKRQGGSDSDYQRRLRTYLAAQAQQKAPATEPAASNGQRRIN